MEEKHACKLTFLAHTDKLSHLLLGPFSHIYGWDHNCVLQYDGDLFKDGSSLKSKMKLTRCKIYLRFICQSCTAWKVSAEELFWSVFSRVRTEYGEIRRYGVSLRIQSECGKIRTSITPNMDTLHAVLIWKLYKPKFLTKMLLDGLQNKKSPPY